MTTTIMRPHAAARRVCLERLDAENVVIGGLRLPEPGRPVNSPLALSGRFRQHWGQAGGCRPGDEARETTVVSRAFFVPEGEHREANRRTPPSGGPRRDSLSGSMARTLNVKKIRFAFAAPFTLR